LALIYLARNDSADYVTAETIATAQKIPLSFLEQILLALKRARFVLSSKGQRGGFRLARAADEMSIADVIRLFDGALAPTQVVSVQTRSHQFVRLSRRRTQLPSDGDRLPPGLGGLPACCRAGPPGWWDKESAVTFDVTKLAEML
jgi:Rrf2 family protein